MYQRLEWRNGFISSPAYYSHLCIAGLLTEDGDINWSCPCLGGMAVGPCGSEFREAFSCFHYSEEEAKGSDCYEQFRVMQECMAKYPDLYPSEQGDNKELAEQESDALDSPDVEEQATAKETEQTEAVQDSAKEDKHDKVS